MLGYCFLRRVALVVGVLLSSKSCFSCWGTAFFEELLQLLGYCFLQRVALHVALSAFWLLRRFALLVGLLGLLRGGLVSLAFQFL